MALRVFGAFGLLAGVVVDSLGIGVFEFYDVGFGLLFWVLVCSVDWLVVCTYVALFVFDFVRV